MLFLNGALGNQLGDCQRQTAGSQCQGDAVNTVGDRINAVAHIAQQIGHGDPVQNTDQPYQNSGNGQNTSLPKQVIFSLC